VSLRDGPLNELRPPLAWLAVAALVLAGIVSLALFVNDHRGSPLDEVRGRFDGVAGAVGGVVSAPVHWVGDGAAAVGAYVDAGGQNGRLRAQLAQARQLEAQVEALREENGRLRALLQVKTDPPLPMVGARTVLDARGPFADTRLADVGSDAGVLEGNPALNEHGLVGRVVAVSPHVSRIMLLTDIESRIPVLIARTNGRAILTGDGGPAPRLDYLRTHDPVRPGDRILTSGDGGVIPRGLPVGVAVQAQDGWRVALDTDAGSIDLVRILLFKDFSQLVGPNALQPGALPSTSTDAPTPPAPPAATAATATPSAAHPAPKAQ
jgi:rod shape-determining protein MreC